jgi:hypothetical protein
VPPPCELVFAAVTATAAKMGDAQYCGSSAISNP